MDDYEGADRRREVEGWHLDKRVPIATLLAILTLALGGILHITQIRTDLEILRQQQATLSQLGNALLGGYPDESMSACSGCRTAYESEHTHNVIYPRTLPRLKYA